MAAAPPPVAADGGATSVATPQDEDQDLTDRIMEYQRREYALLSQTARREREMRSHRRRAGEAALAFEDTRKDSLQNAYVDPAVNIEIAMLRQRLKEKDSEISRLKEEAHNATFHPHSIQGKKLLNKCEHLLEENAELGRQLGEERMQTLRIRLAVERRKRVQLRQRIAEFDQHAELIDAENEKMQNKIADLGQCLKEARLEIDRMKNDINEWTSSSKRKKPPLLLPAAPPPIQDLTPAPAPPEKKRKKHDRD